MSTETKIQRKPMLQRDARYHSSADWHILQHRESASHIALRRASLGCTIFARESDS